MLHFILEMPANCRITVKQTPCYQKKENHHVLPQSSYRCMFIRVCALNQTEHTERFSPAEGDLAGIRSGTHARMQLKKLPHSLAVGTATRNPNSARREVAHEQLDALTRRELACSSPTSLQRLISGSNCPASLSAYVN
jgi:hypothetical protein